MISTSAQHVQQTFQGTMMAGHAASSPALLSLLNQTWHQDKFQFRLWALAVELLDYVGSNTAGRLCNTHAGYAAAGSLASSAADKLRSARAMLQPKTPSSTPTTQAALGLQEEQSMSQAELSAALEVRRKLAWLQNQSRDDL